MKKFFTFAALLLVSVSMNAVIFRMSLRNADAADADKRYVQISESNPDVFGDGKVSVVVDEEYQSILLTLDNASLASTDNESVIMFDGHAEYYLNVKLKGHCTLESRGQGAPVIYLERGDMQFYGEPGVVLDVKGKFHLAQLQGDAYLSFGHRYQQPFTVNFTKEGEDHVIFAGADMKAKEQLVAFTNVNVNITCPAGTEKLAWLLESISTNGKLSDGVVIDESDENDVTFKKDGELYGGNLSITAPMLLAIGSTWVQESDDLSDIQSKNLNKGKISYDKATNTLTLEGVDMDRRIYCGYDNCTIYLKGDNNFSDTYPSEAWLLLRGDNNIITGDADATATFYCHSRCEAISSDGALEINGIQGITAFAAENGILCRVEAKEDDVLKLAAPIEMQCAEGGTPVLGFADVVITDPELQLSQYTLFNFNPIYDKVQQLFVNQDNQEIVRYIAYEFPVYLKFYDRPVTYRNMDDIKIPGSEGKASYNRETGLLVLNGFKNTTAEPTTAIEGTDSKLKIKLLGENEILASNNAIEANYLDITITGPGSLKATALNGAGISIYPLNTLTIRKEATVELIGYDGLSSQMSPTCTPDGGPEDYQLDGDPAYLYISNSTLIAKTTQEDPFYAAIQGIDIPVLEDAEITFPENARFAFECNWSDAYCGLVVDVDDASLYVREATISKTGATAIDQTPFPAGEGRGEASKILRDGQLYIIRDGKTYNAFGAEVR